MKLPAPRTGVSGEFSAYPRKMGTGTLTDPEQVIWSSILHLCSRDVVHHALKNIHGLSHSKQEQEAAKNIKLYIDQAYEFYRAARDARANTGPLLHYYSFLHLAKAVCEIRHPGFHRQPECYRHGLSWSPDKNYIVQPKTESILLRARKGVWHCLWEAFSGIPLNPSDMRIKVFPLLSYCPEIGVEFEAAFGTTTNLVDLQNPSIIYDEERREAWIRFGIDRDSLRTHKVTAPQIVRSISGTYTGYIETKSNEPNARTFEMQTAVAYESEADLARKMLREILALNLYTSLGGERKIEYSIPLQQSLPLRLPQAMTLYTILFWLGSLVRYDPHSLAALRDSRYWILIDGFMSQSRLWLLELFEWHFYQAETTLYLAR